MKGPSSWLNMFFGCQLEKVQKVGAQSPSVAEVADAPETSANGIVLHFVTFLHEQNILIFTIIFCNLKSISRTLAKAYKRSEEVSSRSTQI